MLLPTQSYWHGTGEHQALYVTLQHKLIPSEGRAFTPHGRLLQAANYLYCDRHTNGLCNIIGMEKRHLPVIYRAKKSIVAKLMDADDWNVLTQALSIHAAREHNDPDADYESHESSYVEDNTFAGKPFPDEALEALMSAILLVVQDADSKVAQP